MYWVTEPYTAAAVISKPTANITVNVPQTARTNASAYICGLTAGWDDALMIIPIIPIRKSAPPVAVKAE